MAVVLVLATSVFQLAHYLDAEPLLACVTMGMLTVNRRHERIDKEKEELHHILTQIMSLSNVAFFGLAGASLKLVGGWEDGWTRRSPLLVRGWGVGGGAGELLADGKGSACQVNHDIRCIALAVNLQRRVCLTSWSDVLFPSSLPHPIEARCLPPSPASTLDCPPPHQTALKDMFGAALLVSLVRIGAIYVGSWLGCYVTSTSTEFRRSFWMSMVTQVCVGRGRGRDDTGRHVWSGGTISGGIKGGWRWH